MEKPDERLLKSLCNLENNHDFKVVIEWVMASEHLNNQTLHCASDHVKLFRAQGAAAELREICKVSTEARELAGKLAQQKAGIHIPT